MVFNRFFFKTLLRVIFLFGMLFSLSLIFLKPELFFTQLILLGIIVFQVVELTIFLNKTNYELSRFLDSIKDGDFSLSYSKGNQSASFHRLHSSFANLIETFKGMETEKAAQLHFLNRLVDQIEFGIITFDQKDEIELINQRALFLLDIPKVRNWSNLKNRNTDFLKNLLELGEVRNQLIETHIQGQSRYFSVNMTRINIMGKTYGIASFQDIRTEIQQKEIEAWHKLIRILTHEIMNSVTPLVSLTETIEMILARDNGTKKSASELNQENVDDVIHAISTIRERSQGILEFVQSYRRLTRIPKPNLEPVSTSVLLDGVLKLMEAEFEKSRIKLTTSLSDISLNLDRHLIEQVLINLLKNAKESLTNRPDATIRVTVENLEHGAILSVIDNGPGVAPDKLDRIFIPFYTTKKEGSGIGLSVSRQIMNLHGGILELVSNPTTTKFSLVFPNSLKLPT